MSFRRLSVFVLATALISGCSKPADGGSTVSGNPVAPPSETTLTLKANKGEKYILLLEMDTKAEFAQPGVPPGPHAMKMSLTREHTCVETTSGKTKWELKTLEATGSGTGVLEAEVSQAAEKEKGKTATETKDERNRVLESSEEAPFSVVYPDKAVKPGDTWEAETKFMGQAIKVTFKLDRIEQLEGKSAAVVSATFADTEKLKMLKPLVTFVEVSNGWPIKADGEFEMVPQANVKLHMTARLSRKPTA